MNPADESNGFDRWLDRELGPVIATEAGPGGPPPPAFRRGRRVVRLGLKGATAVLAAVLAVAGGGAAVATGSGVSWNQVILLVSTGTQALHGTPSPGPTAAPAPTGRPIAPPRAQPATNQDDPQGVAASSPPPGQSKVPPGQSKKSQDDQGQNGQGNGHGHDHKPKQQQ